MTKGEIRKSPIAGTWYPGEKSALCSGIESFFRKVPPLNIEGDVISLISPHAGYIYSGQVAAYAYKAVRGEKFDSVVVIGPSHRAYFHGVSVYNGGGYETPLGIVPVDTELVEGMIAQNSSVVSNPASQAQEHSIEIQLPFLQVALGSFRFVPLLMGDQDSSTCESLASTIRMAAGKKRILIVGSSDLSHYHPYEKAVKLDSAALRRMEALNPEALLSDLRSGTLEACGGGPMAVAMLAARDMGANGAKVLKYANSGDVTADKSGVVGYAAAVFFKRTKS